MKAVEKGLKGDAAAQTKALLAEKQPLEVVDEAPDPGAGHRGCQVREGHAVPAAAAAGRKCCPERFFEEIKNVICPKGEGSASKGRIVLATVKGDVHDIGKKHRQGHSGKLRL